MHRRRTSFDAESRLHTGRRRTRPVPLCTAAPAAVHHHGSRLYRWG
ncbi:hypothetical protein ART_1974 [Arthrobacter sp. PAMC 25486]|nr:hypothetical protein ART_1974 [Arthrobacter sp. PAMC 25486]